MRTTTDRIPIFDPLHYPLIYFIPLYSLLLPPLLRRWLRYLHPSPAITSLLVFLVPTIARTGRSIHSPPHNPKERRQALAAAAALPDMRLVVLHLGMERMSGGDLVPSVLIDCCREQLEALPVAGRVVTAHMDAARDEQICVNHFVEEGVERVGARTVFEERFREPDSTFARVFGTLCGFIDHEGADARAGRHTR